MKKLLAMLVALMLCLGCCAALGENVRGDYLGYWKLDTIKMLGTEFKASDLDREGFLSIHEDDTMILSLGENDFVCSHVSYSGGKCLLETVTGHEEAVIGADGVLRFDMSMDSTTMTLSFTRGECPAPLAGIQAWTGVWDMEYAAMGDSVVTAEEVGENIAFIYADGYGIMESEGSLMPFRLAEENGSLVWIDNEGSADPVSMNEKGQLCFYLAGDGADIVMVMNRRGQSAGEATAQEPAVEETPAAAQSGNPFEGKWTAVSVTTLGMDFTMEELGLGEMSLSISGSTADLTWDGESGSCEARYEGDVCIFSDGVDEITCTIDGSNLIMNMEAEGLTLSVRMERIGGAAAPVAETPAAQAPAATAPAATEYVFDGEWRTVAYELLGMNIDAADMDMEVTLSITGGTALLNVDGTKASCTTSISGNVCTLKDRTTSIPCTMKEDGYLYVVLESDGISMTMKMAREGGAPVAPAATQTPAAQPTGTSALIGRWNAVSISLFGMDFTLEDMDLTEMTLEISENSTKLLIDGEGGSFPTTIVNDRIDFEDGTDKLACEIKDGYLILDVTVEGIRMTVKMERAGEALAAQTGEQAPTAGPVPEADYAGTWRAVSVDALGSTFDTETLGMGEITLKIDGASAKLLFGDTDGLCSVTYEADHIIVKDRGGSMKGVINAEGQLVLEMESDGIVMLLKMVRVDEPSAETPAGGSVVSAGVPEELLGVWTMHDAKLQGKTLTADRMDYTVMFVIHEDGTGLLLKDEMFTMFELTITDTGVTAELGGNETPFVIDANGRLNVTLTANGESADMTFDRTELKADPVVAALAGDWELDHIIMNGGYRGPESLPGSVSADIYEDGYGRFIWPEGWFATRFFVEDGVIYGEDLGGSRSRYVLGEDGLLSMEDMEKDRDMVIFLRRTGDAPVAETPAAAETADEGSKASCSFCSQAYVADQGVEVGGMILCPDCYGRYFK